MTRTGTDQEQLLVLGSELAEMARLPDWVKALASRYGIPEKMQFGVELCLEEAVSNVIRHGYTESAGVVRVSVRAVREGYFEFVVEDDAPRFNPLEQAAMPADKVGGHGIRLMRGFADSLEYEAMEGGNRLRIGFAAGGVGAHRLR